MRRKLLHLLFFATFPSFASDTQNVAKLRKQYLEGLADGLSKLNPYEYKGRSFDFAQRKYVYDDKPVQKCDGIKELNISAQTINESVPSLVKLYSKCLQRHRTELGDRFGEVGERAGRDYVKLILGDVPALCKRSSDCILVNSPMGPGCCEASLLSLSKSIHLPEARTLAEGGLTFSPHHQCDAVCGDKPKYIYMADCVTGFCAVKITNSTN